ncbi:MAG: glycerophosphodiester phosphodiesterase [Chloroflexi bacterium]|nr:glycerophosphodiester phosphodiesterase [Chloroflexota bacterium]
MRNVLNIAHRGARSLAPENTIAAARKGMEVGADMWELDVAVTADGKLIVFHDDSLARTTNAQQVFPDRAPWTFTTFTLDELRRLDAGSWFVESDPFGQIAAGAVTEAELAAYPGEPIPTLREALIFSKEQNWCANVELKRLPPPMEHFPVVEHVLALIDALDMGDCAIVSSFNHDWLRQVRAHNPRIKLQALVGYWNTEPLEWDHLEFRTYNPRYTLIDEGRIGALKELGIHVIPWVVNEEEDMKRFIAAGAAGIFTDFPQRLAVLLQQEGTG